MAGEENPNSTEVLMLKKRKLPETESSTSYECSACGETFNSGSGLARHARSEHQSGSRAHKLCPLCDLLFPTFKEIEEHLVDFHGSVINIEEREFSSYEEFKSWKMQEEAQTNTRYNTRTSGTSYNYHAYLCHRSGRARVRGAGAKRRRKPTEKLNRCCPARMVTTAAGATLKCVYHKSHFGHGDAKMLRLSEDQRKKYGEMISKGVSLNRILKEVRLSTQSRSEVRLRTVLRRDEHLLKGVEAFAAFVPENGGIHEWVVEQIKSLDNCVLSYRSETEDLVHCYDSQETIDANPFEKGEFVLILMTNRQSEVISQIATKHIILDCCSCTKESTFEVANLILVDELGNGCPIAFCIASKICAKSIAHFLLTVKDSVGRISAKVFMTVDEPEYHKIWTDIMGEAENSLLCSWDVEKRWRTQLDNIVEFGQMNKIEIFHACCVLLERTDVNGLHEDVKTFLEMSQEHPETVEFGEKFKENYANRLEQWSMCFRNNLNLKNHKLELLHRRLEYCYKSGGSQIHRPLTTCVNKLLQAGDETLLARLVQKAKKPTKIADAIALNHQKSRSITTDMVLKKADNVWMVADETNIETVSITPEIDCRCQYTCIICRRCFHQFSCTCRAYFEKEFCEHAHVCFMLESKSKTPSGFSEEKEEKLRYLRESLNSVLEIVPHMGESSASVVEGEMQKLFDLAKSLVKNKKIS